MDEYNILVDVGKCSLRKTIQVVAQVLRNFDADMVVVNSSHDKREISRKFPDEVRLKTVDYGTRLVSSYVRFCKDYPNEWVLLLLAGGPIPPGGVNRYRSFWKETAGSLYLPATAGALDLSGHLMFASYFTFTKMDPELEIHENIFELNRQGVEINGVQGYYLYRRGSSSFESSHS